MASTIDDYKLKIGVQGQAAVSKLSTSIQNLSKDIGSLGNSSGVLGNSLGSLTGKLGPMGLAATAVAGAFGALGAKALAIADHIGDISAATGISAGALMNFKESLIQAGGSAQSFEQFAKKLSITVGEAAQGNAGYQKSFKDLGVYVRDANQQIRPTGDILRDVLSSLKNIEDPAKRTAMAVKLLGEEAARVDWSTVKAPKDLATDKDIENLNKFNLAIEKLLELLNRKVVSFFGSIAQDILETFGLLDGFEGRVTNMYNRLRAERDAAGTGEFAGMLGEGLAGKTDAELMADARERIMAQIKAEETARRAAEARTRAAATDPRRIDGGGKPGDFGVRDPAGVAAAAAAEAKILNDLRTAQANAEMKTMDQIARMRKQLEVQIAQDIAQIRSNKLLTTKEQEQSIIANTARLRSQTELQINDILKAQTQQIESQVDSFGKANTTAQSRLDLQNKMILATEQERAAATALFDLNTKYAAQIDSLQQQKVNASATIVDKLDAEIAALEKALKIDQARLDAAMKKQAYNNSQKEYDAQIKVLDANRETYGWQLKRDELERSIVNQTERNKTVARQLLAVEEARAGKLKEISNLTVLDAAKRKNLIENVNSDYDRQREIIEENYRRETEAQDSFVGGWTNAFEKWRNGLKTNADYAADMFTTMTNGLEDAFVSFVQTGKLSFKGLINSMIADFARMQAQKLFSSIMGKGNFLSNLFGGFFADGGTLGAGKWGIAGEAGPEIIQGPANIIPMQKVASTTEPTQTVITYNINATDAASFKAMVARDPQFLYAVTEQGRRSLPSRRG